MIQAPNEHQPGLQVEVAGLPVALAQCLLADLDQLRAELNVYRGHLLDVSLDPMEGVILAFANPPGLSREDVVLPGDLALRKAIKAAYQLGHLPTQQEVLAIAENWRPYRSLATSYLFAAGFDRTS